MTRTQGCNLFSGHQRYVLCFISLFIFTGLLSFTPLRAAAQDARTELEVPSDTLSAPEDGSVLSKIDKDIHLIRTLEESFVVDPVIMSIEMSIDSFMVEIDTLSLEFAQLPNFRLSLRDLDLVTRKWTRFNTQAEEWSELVHSRMDELETTQVQLSGVRDSWTAFIEKDEAIDLEYVRARIEEMVANSGSLVAGTLGRIDELFRLSDTLDEQRTRLEDLGDELTARQAATRVNMLTRDGEMLPFAVFSSDDEEAYGTQVAASVNRDLTALQQYYVLNTDRFVVSGIAFLLLLVLTISIRWISRSWDESDVSMTALLVAASRPVSTALLLFIFVVAVLLDDAPPVILDAVRLLALIPMLRLLPGMIPKKYRNQYYLFLGLLLLSYAHAFFRVGSAGGRLVLLGISIGLVLILGTFIFSRTRGPEDRKTVLTRGATFLTFVVFVLLIVGSVANFVGYGEMAEVLGEGSLTTIFSALGVYAVIKILEGLWKLFIESRVARGLHAVKNYTGVILIRGRFVIRAAMILWWLSTMPRRFGLEYLSVSWTTNLLQKSFMIGAMTINIANIFAFVVTIWATVLLSRFVRFILETDIFPRSGTPQGMRSAASSLTNYVMLSVGFLVALTAAGVDFENLTLLAGAFGIGIGFGLQTIVGNFVSGLILIFERPIQVGDVIEFAGPGGNQMAIVGRIGIRSSVVRKFDGAEVILPNSTLVSNAVTNWTKTDKRRRIEIVINVTLDTSPKPVLDILRQIADENPRILTEPAPLPLLRDFGTHSLEFSLWAWTADFNIGLSLKSEMAVRLHEALEEAGIEIAVPARRVSLESRSDGSSPRGAADSLGDAVDSGSEETPEA